MGRQTRTLCVFFEKGKCRSGDACRFTHGASDTRELEKTAATEAAATTGEPCKYFARGKCTRGDRCPFQHSRPGRDDTDEEAAPMTVASKRPAPGGALSPARSCPSPRRPPLAASAATAAAAGAAAGVAGGGKPPPRKPPPPPPRGGSSSRQKLGSTGGPAGSWADVVTRTKSTTNDDLGSTFGVQRSSAGTSSTADEEMPAAVASAAASAAALKAARKAEKKAARAAAAAAAAAAATTSGTRISAVEPATTGRRLYGQPQQQGGEDRSLGGTSSNGVGGGGGGDGSSKKGTKQRSVAKPCVFFPRGRCRYGDGCRFSHDVVDKGGHEEEEGEGEEEDEVVVVEEETIADKEAALDKAEKLQSRRAECAVCLEVVRKVDRAKDRTFGILVHCRHVFCLKCITEWRNKSKSHECPECQVPSPFVVPSRTLVTDPSRKERLLSTFRRSSGGGVPFSAKPSSSGSSLAVIDLTAG